MKNDFTPANRAQDDDVPAGRLEARYLAFIETIMHLRPSLHRYCARMIGSVLDGEDVVQEALFQAYRKLDTFNEARPLARWLFGIAHNRCIDVLRQRGTRERAETEAAVAEGDFMPPVEPVGPALDKAVEHLVLILPPKERACVLLKDIFDYSLEEIAALVDSTVGGVKAALHRGRSKLAGQPIGAPSTRVHVHTAEDAALLRLYLERFNRRDWVGVRELIAADARLVVADRFVGRVVDSPYFATYEQMQVSAPWRLAVGEIDGEIAIIIKRANGEDWQPGAVARLRVSDGRIAGITDYWNCPWIVSAATSLLMNESS